MLTLIEQAEIHAPEPLGRRDVLIAGGQIMAIEPSIDLTGRHVERIDGRGHLLVPGFIDALTHPCGGGGEGGFGNRTAEIPAAEFIEAGITSPVGALGTDSITRSLEVLYGCVMGLRAHGLSAFMYTGAYHVPPVTLTGNVTRDLTLIAPVIGLGEVAISDHRSSAPTIDELRRLAAEARVGGIVAGKGGAVMVHVGDGPVGLAPLREAIEGSDLPNTSFYPTHANRNRQLLDDAIEFARLGASIDFTVSTTPEFIADGEIPALAALAEALASGIPIERLTLSSDAGGSLPRYVDGKLVALEAASPGTLLAALKEAFQADPESLPLVLAALTSSPARALGLAGKGSIAAQADADLLLLDRSNLGLTHVMCGGRWLWRENALC